VQFAVDNDLFVPGKTDRWYTNGLRLSWSYGRESKWLVSKSFADLLAQWTGPSVCAAPITYSIGQSIYSPRQIGVAAAQPEDRPWAGFSYFSMAAQHDAAPYFSATEIKLGVTGRDSGAQAVQTQWHRLIGSPHPAGWEHQTIGRPIVQLTFARLTRESAFWNKNLALQHGWGAAVGNARVYGTATVALVLGSHGQQGVSGQSAPILIANEGDFVLHDNRERSLNQQPYTYLALSANAVAYNYFIEGPVPYINGIRTLPAFATAQWGVSLPLGKWLWVNRDLRLTYALNVRTSEYRLASTNEPGGVQRWGSFGLLMKL
jgi:hypothetical protein